MCQTKPSMKDSGWAEWFIDESGERMKQGQVQALGGERHQLMHTSQYKVLKGLTLWDFDLWPYKQYMYTILDSTLLHIVGAWNMSPVKECSPPDFRLHNGLCFDTPTLTHTHTHGRLREHAFTTWHIPVFQVFEVVVRIYLNLKKNTNFNQYQEPLYTSSDPI